MWGDSEPEYVLLHGGAQNAHTWDTVALALDVPLVAIDLPEHGHSAWRENKAYRPQQLAGDVTYAIDRARARGVDARRHVARRAHCVVAADRGGHRPSPTASCSIDVTPGVNQEKAEPILSFISGPESFASFDEILERTMAVQPDAVALVVAAGCAPQRQGAPDGTWAWRYDLPDRRADRRSREPASPTCGNAMSAVEAPILLVQGGLSGVVDDDDVAELRATARRPGRGGGRGGTQRPG